MSPFSLLTERGSPSFPRVEASHLQLVEQVHRVEEAHGDLVVCDALTRSGHQLTQRVRLAHEMTHATEAPDHQLERAVDGIGHAPLQVVHEQNGGQVVAFDAGCKGVALQAAAGVDRLELSRRVSFAVAGRSITEEADLEELVRLLKDAGTVSNLNLRGLRVPVAALGLLGDVVTITNLDLTASPVVTVEAVPFLAASRQLKLLRVGGTTREPLDPSFAEEMRLALPNCTILQN